MNNNLIKIQEMLLRQMKRLEKWRKKQAKAQEKQDELGNE